MEEFDDVCGLVLEYVPGDTVDRRVAAGAIPQKAALLICRQVAEALEAAHAKGIVHRDGDKMMVVPISMAGGFQPCKPRLLWESHYSPGLSSSCGMPGVTSGNYDVTADGQRFVMVKDNGLDAFSTKLVVVLNWASELK